MTKRKTLRNTPPRIFSNSSKLTGTRESAQVEIRRESTDDSPGMGLNDIPTISVVAPDNDTHVELESRRRSARDKSKKRKSPAPDAEDGGGDSDSDPLPKRRKTPTIVIADDDPDFFAEAEDDDKKKLGVETSYEGFNIYSRILCIVVKRRGNAGRRAGAAATEAKGKIMEDWISMSQAIDGGDVE